VLPQNEHELLVAIFCVTTALAKLHEHGYMHRDIRWPNVIKYKDRAAWFIIDFEHAGRFPSSKDSVAELVVGTHAPEMFTKPFHTASVDLWGVGRLIADSGVAITSKSLDDLKHELLGVDRPTAATVRNELVKIHQTICHVPYCAFTNNL